MKSDPTAERVLRTISIGNRSGEPPHASVRLLVRGRQELVEQIAFAAHDLDTVVTGVASQLRAAREVVDGAFHPVRRELARPERVYRRLDRRRAHRKRMVGIASRMKDLQQDLAALVVHRVGDGPMAAGVRRRRHLGRERK